MRRSANVCAAMVAFLISWVPITVRAAHGDHLVVAEVQVGGASARDEFVELYNPTANPIAIEGWRLSKRTASGNESNLVTAFPAVSVAPHASFLIAHPDGAFVGSADQRYTTQESLANDNTIVLYAPLRDGTRPVADLVGWGTAGSREGAAAPNPPSGQSLERKPGGQEGNAQDTGDNAADFALTPTPTPQNASAAARPAIPPPAPPPPTDDAAESPPATPPESPDTDDESARAPASFAAPSAVAPVVQPTHVRINEFVADPETGDEWVEIVNTGTQPVNLADWVIEDGAETRTVLVGAVGTGDQRFHVITKPKGQLNNSGDRIVLKDPTGNIVDAVSYGDWDDGKTSDNAPTAADPASVARVVDGQDTGNDRLDFVRTETPTPGAPNVVASVPEESEASATPSRSASPARAPRAIVVLNELFPNPPGDDLQDETIEIANIGTAAADLAGWRLRDELGAEYVLASADGATAIPAGGFLLLARSRTGIAINNTGGETVRFFAPDAERAASVATFTGEAPEGLAWARGEDGRWSWTTARTPNMANVIAPPNRMPDAAVDGPVSVEVGAVVALDASDSADPDREPVAAAWDFGDPRTEADHAEGAIGRYAYDQPGTYTVALTVRDARGGMATAQHRVTVRPRAMVAGIKVEAETLPSAFSSSSASAPLLLSELLPNPMGSDTEEWIEIENAGDAPATLSGWTIAAAPPPSDGTAAEFRSSPLPDAPVPAAGFLMLPRTVFHLALQNGGATIELRRPDGSVADRATYGRTVEGKSFARGADGAWGWSEPTPGRANAMVAPPPAPIRSARAGAVSSVVTLAELREHEVGEIVTVRGSVVAPFGSVGAQILYIGDGGDGVQVFVGKRTIPTLARGDTVEVTGELREVGGERRVGIRKPEDVRRIGSGVPAEPDAIRAQDADGERIGALLAVEGEVVEARGRNVTVDDGSEELRVVLPADGIPEGVTAGDTIRAVGVLSRTRSGFRLLARDAGDIERMIRVVPSVPALAAPPAFLSRSAEVAVLGGAVLLALFLILRNRLSTAFLTRIRAVPAVRTDR